MNNVDNINNQTFIIFDEYDKFKKIESYEWYNKLCNKNGIWVGNEIDEQEIFAINNLKNYDIDEDLKQLIYIIDDNNYVVAKGVGGDGKDDLFEY